jgi:hypothetical protein
LRLSRANSGEEPDFAMLGDRLMVGQCPLEALV